MTQFTINSHSLDSVKLVFPDAKVVRVHLRQDAEPCPICLYGCYSGYMPHGTTLVVSGSYSRNKLTKLLGSSAWVRGVKNI
jgi:hypothetical protein